MKEKKGKGKKGRKEKGKGKKRRKDREVEEKQKGKKRKEGKGKKKGPMEGLNPGPSGSEAVGELWSLYKLCGWSRSRVKAGSQYIVLVASQLEVIIC